MCLVVIKLYIRTWAAVYLFVCSVSGCVVFSLYFLSDACACVCMRSDIERRKIGEEKTLFLSVGGGGGVFQ